MSSLWLTTWLAVALAQAGSTVALRHRAQHTNTSTVRDICLTRNRVWAATGGGLAVHRRRDGRFLFKLTSADGLPGNSLRLVRPVGSDRLLVGGDFGAAVVAHADQGRPGADLQVRSFQIAARHDVYSPVSALLEPASRDRGGPVLVVLQRGPVELRHDARGELEPGGELGVPGWWYSAASSDTHIALGDTTGRLVIHERRALRQRAGGESKRQVLLDGPVLSLARIRNTWVAASGEGLFRIEQQRVRQVFIRDKQGRAFPVSATVLADIDADRLLVGTADGSVLELIGVDLKPVVPALGGRITALREDGDRLWIGLEGQGLQLGHTGTGRPPVSLRPFGEICGNHVTNLARHRGRLVAGTFDRGACVLTGQRWKTLELPSPMVHGLASDGYYLYVASSGGLSRFGPRFEPRPVGDRDPRALRWFAGMGNNAATRIRERAVAVASRFGVLRILRTRRGHTWVRHTSHKEGAPYGLTDLAAAAGAIFAASETEGVKRLGLGRRDAWHLQDPRVLTENWVTSISAVGPEEVWVATCQQGAVHVKRISRPGDRTRVRRFGTREGLPDMRLTSVAANRHGAFLGTLNGLAWADADGTRAVGFGLSAGLPDPRSSALMLRRSLLWIGTEAGLACFEVVFPSGRS